MPCLCCAFLCVQLDRIANWDDRVCGPVGGGLTPDQEWERHKDYLEALMRPGTEGQAAAVHAHVWEPVDLV